MRYNLRKILNINLGGVLEDEDIKSGNEGGIKSGRFYDGNFYINNLAQAFYDHEAADGVRTQNHISFDAVALIGQSIRDIYGHSGNGPSLMSIPASRHNHIAVPMAFETVKEDEKNGLNLVVRFDPFTRSGLMSSDPETPEKYIFFLDLYYNTVGLGARKADNPQTSSYSEEINNFINYKVTSDIELSENFLKAKTGLNTNIIEHNGDKIYVPPRKDYAKLKIAAQNLQIEMEPGTTYEFVRDGNDNYVEFKRYITFGDVLKEVVVGGYKLDGDGYDVENPINDNNFRYVKYKNYTELERGIISSGRESLNTQIHFYREGYYEKDLKESGTAILYFSDVKMNNTFNISEDLSGGEKKQLVKREMDILSGGVNLGVQLKNLYNNREFTTFLVENYEGNNWEDGKTLPETQNHQNLVELKRLYDKTFEVLDGITTAEALFIMNDYNSLSEKEKEKFLNKHGLTAEDEALYNKSEFNFERSLRELEESILVRDANRFQNFNGNGYIEGVEDELNNIEGGADPVRSMAKMIAKLEMEMESAQNSGQKVEGEYSQTKNPNSRNIS